MGEFMYRMLPLKDLKDLIPECLPSNCEDADFYLLRPAELKKK